MIKEELEKEAEKWLRKFLLCNDCKRKCHCIELNAYCEEQVLKAYIDSAEPREKRIADLEAQIEKMKNCFNCAKGDWNDRVKCINSGCVNKSKWEIKEND